MNKNKGIHILLASILTIITLLGNSIRALAEGPYQPNYGSPITVDGDPSDWDLDVDFFSTLYRNFDSNDLAMADVYMRFHSDSGVFYVLVLSRSGQNVIMNGDPNVMVDQMVRDVTKEDTPPDGIQPDFSWVNPDSTNTFAEGWEASIRWADAIDPSASSHQILVFSNLHDGSLAQKVGTPGQFVPIDVFSWDYGDLPDTYGTYDASNGPKHHGGDLRLGLQVDGESNGQPSTTPILDDLFGRNDEDGLVVLGNWLNMPPEIQYTINGCSGSCYFNLWIDWEEDGVFDVFTDTITTNQLVANGTDVFSFSLPSGDFEFPAILNARVRLCDQLDGCATPHALSPTDAPPGEVEDYQWQFSPTTVTLNSFSATPIQSPVIFYILMGALFAIVFFGLTTLANRRRNRRNDW